ncbi:MAG: hypothetical protein P8Z35_22190 [Ignavibacteriaceae bacterium]
MVYDTLFSMEVHTVFCSVVHIQIFKSTENVLVVDYPHSHLVMPLCDLAIILGV